MKHLLIVIIGCLSVCVNGIGQTTTPADTVLAEEYYQKGKALTDALKDFETALDYYERAAAIFLKYEKWERYVDCLNKMASSYYWLLQNDMGLMYARKALAIVQNKFKNKNSIQECHSYLLIGDYYKYRTKNSKAIYYYEKAMEKLNQTVDKGESLQISLFLRIGFMSKINNKYSKAESYYKSALDLAAEKFGANSLNAGHIKNSLGVLYIEVCYYDSAIKYFSEALRTLEYHHGKDVKQLGLMFNNIGLAHQYRGDCEVARLYFEKAISCSEKDQFVFFEYAPLYYNNLGLVYRDEGDMQNTLRCYLQSLKIRDSSPFSTNLFYKALTYENLGLLYVDKQEYEQALNYIMKSLYLRKREFDDDLALAESYCALGNAYLKSGDFVAAEVQFHNALKLQEKAVGDFDDGITNTYCGLGNLYFAKGEYVHSIKNFHKALIFQFHSFKDSSVYSNPRASRVLAPNSLLAYRMKAIAFKKLFDSGKFDLKLLLFSFDTFQECDSLIGVLSNSHLRYSDKLIVSRGARETYEGAISVSLQLYQLTKDISYLHSAFYFSERSKAAALSHGLSDLKARSLSGVPQELLSLESRLKSDMAVYQQQAQDEKSKLGESDSASVSYFQDRLFYATRSYDSLIRVLEKNYPHYYALKYSTNTVSLIDLEAKLDKNTALIEYFVGDSTTYVFYATLGQSGYIALPHTRTLHDDVVALRANLNPQQVYDNPSGSYDAFVKASARVYDEYVKHVIQKLPASVTNLIIIPDGSLGYIPFEVLLTARPVSGDYASLPYLMKRYRVSYGYSASLLEEYESVHKKNSKVNYLAFAPRYASEETDSTRLLRLGRYRSQVTPLHWNTAEAIRIGRYLPGKSLVDDEAKESVFKEEVNKYSILHLAMHALVDDQRPMNSKFVFSAASDSTEDGFLTANELYAMDLSAELVVLSACETGYGKLEKGEGIMSLARAFSYAGCPSVVMSHWVVDDEATAQLMEYFYKHLSSGLSKDEALQQAREDYLAHADVLKQHPAFWAGFVILGDTRAITERSSGWVYVMMGGIVLIAVGFYLSKKLRRRA